MKFKKLFGLALSSVLFGNVLVGGAAFAKGKSSGMDDGGVAEVDVYDDGSSIWSIRRTVSAVIDGQEVSFDVVIEGEGVPPDDGVAEGIFGTFVKKLFEFAADQMSGGGGGGGGGGNGGGGGGGTTITCNHNLNGATVVVIGNLNCGGTQTGTSGSGSQGGTRPQ